MAAVKHKWRKRAPSLKYSYWDCAKCGEFIFDMRGRKHASPLFDRAIGKCGKRKPYAIKEGPGA